MTLQEAKFEISQKIKEIKALLQFRKLEIHPDYETKSNHMSFNGYSHIDAFVNDVETDLYPQIVSLINLCHLNELDIQKREILVESIIESLSFEKHIELSMYDEVQEALDSEQGDYLKEFMAQQIRLQKWIVAQLEQEYPTRITANLKDIARLKWNGTQIDLCELFQTLERRGWITVNGTKASYYRTLSTVFFTDDSDNLLKNITDYLTKDKVKPRAFSDIPPAKIK